MLTPKKDKNGRNYRQITYLIRLGSRIYKGNLQLNDRKTNNSTFAMGKGFERTFLQSRSAVASRPACNVLGRGEEAAPAPPSPVGGGAAHPAARRQRLPRSLVRKGQGRFSRTRWFCPVCGQVSDVTWPERMRGGLLNRGSAAPGGSGPRQAQGRQVAEALGRGGEQGEGHGNQTWAPAPRLRSPGLCGPKMAQNSAHSALGSARGRLQPRGPCGRRGGGGPSPGLSPRGRENNPLPLGGLLHVHEVPAMALEMALVLRRKRGLVPGVCFSDLGWKKPLVTSVVCKAHRLRRPRSARGPSEPSVSGSPSRQLRASAQPQHALPRVGGAALSQSDSPGPLRQ